MISLSGQKTPPRSISGELWNPYTSSTPSRTPSSIIGLAPPGPSSAGWYSSLTVQLEGSLSRCYSRNQPKPVKLAIWPSWPHICAARSLTDRYGRSGLPSSMTRASMSALKAMHFGVVDSGPVPLTSTTNPVSANVHIWSGCTPRSNKKFWIYSLVFHSLNPVSGC